MHRDGVQEGTSQGQLQRLNHFTQRVTSQQPPRCSGWGREQWDPQRVRRSRCCLQRARWRLRRHSRTLSSWCSTTTCVRAGLRVDAFVLGSILSCGVLAGCVSRPPTLCRDGRTLAFTAKRRSLATRRSSRPRSMRSRRRASCSTVITVCRRKTQRSARYGVHAAALEGAATTAALLLSRAAEGTLPRQQPVTAALTLCPLLQYINSAVLRAQHYRQVRCERGTEATYACDRIALAHLLVTAPSPVRPGRNPIHGQCPLGMWARVAAPTHRTHPCVLRAHFLSLAQ